MIIRTGGQHLLLSRFSGSSAGFGDWDELFLYLPVPPILILECGSRLWGAANCFRGRGGPVYVLAAMAGAGPRHGGRAGLVLCVRPAPNRSAADAAKAENGSARFL